MSILMIATSRFSHRGRMLNVGEQFTASPVEAAAYTYQRIATYRADAKVLTSEPPAATDAPPTRRRYRRRDLTAEQS